MLAVGVMAVVMVLGYTGMVIAGYLAAAHQARLAADLAALSGAAVVIAGADGCEQAARTARANAGRAIECGRVGDQIDYVVTVRVAVPVSSPIPGLPEQVEAVAYAGPGAE